VGTINEVERQGVLHFGLPVTLHHHFLFISKNEGERGDWMKGRFYLHNNKYFIIRYFSNI